MTLRKEALIRTARPIIVRAIIIVGVASVLAWVLIKAFTITTIEVVGTGMLVEVDKEKIINNLLFFPTDKLRAEILENNPLLSDVQFEKKFPQTLVIKPIVRSSFVRLKTSDRQVLLDREGVVLGESSGTENLPLLLFPDITVRTGQKIRDTRVQQGVLLYQLVDGILPIEYITSADTSSLRVKSEKLDIFFPQDANIVQILATLQTLMTGFRIKGTLPTVVDLRFDKPVVKF